MSSHARHTTWYPRLLGASSEAPSRVSGPGSSVASKGGGDQSANTASSARRVARRPRGGASGARGDAAGHVAGDFVSSPDASFFPSSSPVSGFGVRAVAAASARATRKGTSTTSDAGFDRPASFSATTRTVMETTPFPSRPPSGSGTRHPSHAQSRGGRSASRSVSSASRTPPSSPPFSKNVCFFVPSAEVVLTMYRVTAERSAAMGAGNGGAGSHATQTVRRRRSSDSRGKYASKERSSSSRGGASGPPDASTRASSVGAAGGAADEGSNTPPTQPPPGVVDKNVTFVTVATF